MLFHIKLIYKTGAIWENI